MVFSSWVELLVTRIVRTILTGQEAMRKGLEAVIVCDNMRALGLVAVLFVGIQAGFGQTESNAAQGLPSDPRELLAAAAPFYDFSDAGLKPWHFKASYQLYDEQGNPSEPGTYEYWWASPQVHRSTWTRGNSTHTDWHTADGKHAYQATGERLNFFEYKLQTAFLSPLPKADDLDSTKVRLDRQNVQVGSAKLPCIMVVPLMPQHGQVQTVPLGLFPTYCFDTKTPVLRISYSWGTVTTEFNQIVKLQGKYMAKEILLFEGKRKILSATVDSIAGLPAADPAMIPGPDVTVSDSKKVDISGGVAQGMLLKKIVPVYPQDAKDARVSGTVLLQATIGMDGGIHDLRVLSAPWPSLAASALWSVSHWEYKPYLMNGEPVEVKTTINVVFSLSN
jgi:TonB family protein